MKKLKKYLVVPLLTLLMMVPILAMPMSAGAATGAADAINNLEQVGTEGFGVSPGSTQSSLPVMVGRIINIALGLLGVIAVVLIVYAGFLWMTARGNDQAVGDAKKILMNSVIGLVIIMAAYAIATFVVNSIVTATTAS